MIDPLQADNNGNGTESQVLFTSLDKPNPTRYTSAQQKEIKK